MNKKVAIIIVNWNGKRFLENCLTAVIDQSCQSFDVYFVDNGSEDDSVSFVEKNFPQVKIVRLDHNTGYARGNNEGIKKALQDEEIKYFVFLNNDTIVERDWLEEMVKVAEKDSEIGMVSPKAFFIDGRIQTIGLSLEKGPQTDKDGGLSIGYGESPEKFDKELEIFAPSGVSAFFKREVLEEVGFFDEDFFAYSEDLDLGYRARLAGWKCFYTPKAKLIHLHSQTSGGVASPFKAFHIKRNHYLLVIKNFPLNEMLTFPFREIFWNFKNVFPKKNKLESVNKLNKSVGKRGIIKIMIRVYLSVLYNLPKTLIKRKKIQKQKKVDKKTIENWFVNFSR